LSTCDGGRTFPPVFPEGKVVVLTLVHLHQWGYMIMNKYTFDLVYVTHVFILVKTNRSAVCNAK